MMKNSKLIYFPVLLLANKNTLVEELTILTCIKSVVLHCYLSWVVVADCRSLFVCYLWGLKLIFISMVPIFIL